MHTIFSPTLRPSFPANCPKISITETVVGGSIGNGLKLTFRHDIMSVFGLESGYTEKYGQSPRKFPRAAPSTGVQLASLGSGHVSPNIPCLVLIRIQSQLLFPSI